MLRSVYSRVFHTLSKPSSKPICATLCTNQAKKDDKETHTKNDIDFVPVYHFPYIRVFSVINKIKKYQTVLTGAGIPTSLIFHQMGQIPMDAVQFTAALGISGCLVLHTAGWLTSKFIGVIYYNESKNAAKISYVDFWGSRKDVEIPTSDIMPINELPRTPMDGLYFTFRRYSSKEKFKLSLKYGVVLDKERLEKVL